MILAKVVGTVVATRKDPRLVSTKLLIARAMDPRGKPEGSYVKCFLRRARSRHKSPLGLDVPAEQPVAELLLPQNHNLALALLLL